MLPTATTDSARVYKNVPQLARIREQVLLGDVWKQPEMSYRDRILVTWPEDEKDRLHGGSEAVKAWSEAGADLVLGGHIHLPYMSDVCALVQGTSRTMFCIQAGTALSYRVRHGSPNSFNVIAWHAPGPGEPRVCKAARWDYDLAEDRFECTHERELELAGA